MDKDKIGLQYRYKTLQQQCMQVYMTTCYVSVWSTGKEYVDLDSYTRSGLLEMKPGQQHFCYAMQNA